MIQGFNNRGTDRENKTIEIGYKNGDVVRIANVRCVRNYKRYSLVSYLDENGVSFCREIYYNDVNRIDYV